MANAVFEVQSETAATEAALARLKKLEGDLTASEKELASAILKVEEAEKRRAKALGLTVPQLKDMERRTEAVSNAAGKAGQNASKLAGALGLVSPQAAEAARTVADLADVGEVAGEASAALGVSLGTLALAAGALTVVVGAGYLAWKAYHAEEEAAREASEHLASALKSLQPIHQQAESSALALAHARGEVSDAEYAYQQALSSAKAARDQSVTNAREQVRANQELLDGLGAAARTLDGKLVPAAQKYTDAIAEGTAVINSADRAYDTTEQNLRGVRDATLGAEAAARAKAAADKLAAEMARAAAEADRLAAQAAAEREAEVDRQVDNAGRLANARASLHSQISALGATEAQQIQARAEAMQAEITRLEELGGVTADTAADRVRIEDWAQGEIDRLRSQAAEKERARLDELAAANLAHVNQVGGAIVQGIGTFAASLDATYEHSASLAAQLESQLAQSEEFLTDAQADALRKRTKAARDAAEKQFAAAKAAKVAEALASTALAAINAISQSPPPSPFGLIGAGIATGAGLAAVATIEQQQPAFTDTPGVMEMGGGGSVHLADGDLFAAAHTRAELEKQVSGAGGTMVVETHWKHQVIDRTVSETYRRGGRLQREVSGRTSTTSTGHARR